MTKCTYAMTNEKLPFLLPSLKDVPQVIYKHMLEPEALAYLQFSEHTCTIINTYIHTVGLYRL